MFDKCETTDYIMILGITIGMRYLHKKGICPYLFCPQTILIDENLFPIISEFEVTPRLLYTDQAFFPEENKIYPYYSSIDCEFIPPEQNVFAFSLIVYQIITKNFNFLGKKVNRFGYQKCFSRGERPNISCIHNKCIRKLLKNCWDRDPNNRMTFDQILNYITNEDFIDSFRSININMVKHYLEIYGDEFKEIMNKF